MKLFGMKKKTSRVFILGLVVILLGSAYKPLILLTLGEKAQGHPIKVAYEASGFWDKAGYYPAVEYLTPDNKLITFKLGTEIDIRSELLERVEVLYFPAYPQLAECNTFHCLFDSALLKIALCLFLWLAFFTSFTDFFDPQHDGTEVAIR